MKRSLFILLLFTCLACVNAENEQPKKRKPVNKNIPIRKIYRNSSPVYNVPVYKKYNYLIITIDTIRGKKDTVMAMVIN
jgi:hypothetical protein